MVVLVYLEGNKSDRRWQVLCEYIVWKIRNNEVVEQKYFDALAPEVVAQLIKKATK